MKAIIIYHGGCFDGVAGAWVCRRYLEGLGKQHEEVLLHAAHYGDPPPDVTDMNVFIVDFSYPKDTMLAMHDKANKMLVMDHHQTSEKNLKGLDFCIFDMNKSGASLAWDVLFPRDVRPWIVNAVEDRDLWRFKLPTTRGVIAYLASKPLIVDLIEEVSHMSSSQVYEKGAAILDYIETYGKKVCENWMMKRIAGYDVPVINTQYMNSSDHVDRLIDMLPGHPFYAYFFLKPGGWQFGLRSRGEFDVAKIAEQFGGGGHRNASGFNTSQLPWENPRLEQAAATS